MQKVSILIPAFNAENTIAETLNSCIKQDYPFTEIIVSDNHSTDRTCEFVKCFPSVRLEENHKNIGYVKNMEKLIQLSTGKYIVFMCADDYFTCPQVITDLVIDFIRFPNIGYVGRWYYQFINKNPVRHNHSLNPYHLADNPSGLAFRREAISGRVWEQTFAETAGMAKEVIDKGWEYKITKWDTTAVRMHCGNGSAKPEAFEQSPVLNWFQVVGPQKFFLTNFVSLLQIKNWGKREQLIREINLFIRLKPSNVLRPDFWFFAFVSFFIPRFVLKRLIHFYKLHIGGLFCRERKR